ncbi:MAG TPA: DUF1343 domain-containing protein [Thermoanaerobaculia bacterium]|nr:DUF1343 domain-containing protein [Thermoanaerobaculia bacterium]MBP7812281.1 DUF1343 domain-containing protein [Thermoanaerobaculia bacterium]MBP8845304.1 DUF1343 domain-containing protein [Thermoanaerobaculia bacterium]HPA94904.1 DUF1343 domain-containing protein [Thermoanaerobaculia bacterium]HQP93889.1 DUF1343 domain-containing protein [Thermoanaerobaculia bacterium]
MIASGLDRLVAEADALRGRRYALLTHAAALTSALAPAHLALAARVRPALLLAPEHGLHGVEQDMVAVGARPDPWTGLPTASLYGTDAASLRPAPERFAGLDLLVVDLQDIGTRYYTYVAAGVWAAASAARAGCEVWWLDRPNPLGGVVEGNRPRPGFASYVGAFDLPVRHGLTGGEIALREARREGWEGALRIWPVSGWEERSSWPAWGRPWLAPSPNMPDYPTALVYPGLCLLEATGLSEGRGTTRPFRLCGAPGVDAPRLAAALTALRLPGLAFVPALFRPQFQKHAGELCGGVEIVIVAAEKVRPVAAGVRILAALARELGASFSWRQAPYEFVSERPAIDLLTGGDELRRLIETGDDPEAWIASWERDERAYREEWASLRLYGAKR